MCSSSRCEPADLRAADGRRDQSFPIPRPASRRGATTRTAPADPGPLTRIAADPAVFRRRSQDRDDAGRRWPAIRSCSSGACAEHGEPGADRHGARMSGDAPGPALCVAGAGPCRGRRPCPRPGLNEGPAFAADAPEDFPSRGARAARVTRSGRTACGRRPRASRAPRSRRARRCGRPQARRSRPCVRARRRDA